MHCVVISTAGTWRSIFRVKANCFSTRSSSHVSNTERSFDKLKAGCGSPRGMHQHPRFETAKRGAPALLCSDLVLAHVDFGAVLLELHLIHELIDQVDAAAVVGVDVFPVAGDREWRRDRSRCRDRARRSACRALRRSLRNIELSWWDRSCSRGRWRWRGPHAMRFRSRIPCRRRIPSARHLHNAFDHRTDGGGIGVERDLNAYHQFAAIEVLPTGSPAGMASAPTLDSRALTVTEKLLGSSRKAPA